MKSLYKLISIFFIGILAAFSFQLYSFFANEIEHSNYRGLVP